MWLPVSLVGGIAVAASAIWIFPPAIGRVNKTSTGRMLEEHRQLLYFAILLCVVLAHRLWWKLRLRRLGVLKHWIVDRSPITLMINSSPEKTRWVGLERSHPSYTCTESMQITYQLTDEDYRQGLQMIRQPAWMRLGFYSVTVVYVLAVLVGLAFRIEDPNSNAVKNLQPLVVIFAIWIALIGLRPNRIRRAIRKQLQNTPSAGVPTTLTISETGLQFHSAYTDATQSWSSFIKWAEGNSVFALFTGPKFVTIVPKRGFADGDLERFRDIVNRSIASRQG